MKHLVIILVLTLGMGSQLFANNSSPKLMRLICTSPKSGNVFLIEQANVDRYDGRVFADKQSEVYKDQWRTNAIPFVVKLFKGANSRIQGVNGDDFQRSELLLELESNGYNTARLDWVGSRLDESFGVYDATDKTNSILIEPGKENEVRFRNNRNYETIECNPPFLVDPPKAIGKQIGDDQSATLLYDTDDADGDGYSEL